MLERTLALRYITAQKRHSILTICSIVAALTLMTMLFTGFSTVMGCMRDVSYHQQPYHLRFTMLEEQQAHVICDMAKDKYGAEYRLKSAYDGTKVVDITFRGYIGEELFSYDGFVTTALKKAGCPDNFPEVNALLIQLDQIDLSSKVTLVQVFAIFYVFIIFLALLLRLIIDTAFEVSSKERERQFGVLQSVGAAPGQIVRIITYEGLILSGIGIPLGLLCGTGLGYAAFRAVLTSGIAEAYLSAQDAAELVRFHVSPLLLGIAAVTGLIWVLLSAYGTGMRIIRMTPMQAISNRSNTVKKVRRFSLFGLLFGWKGKLAARNNGRQPKRFLITVLSLTLSISLFASTNTIMDTMQEMMDSSDVLAFGIRDFEVGYSRDYDTLAEYQLPLDDLERSGLFETPELTYARMAFCFEDDSQKKVRLLCSLIYCNREAYQRIFAGEPPMSYDDLASIGGYALVKPGEDADYGFEANDYHAGETIHAFTTKEAHVSIADYKALSEEARAELTEVTSYDEATGNSELLCYARKERQAQELRITTEGISPVEYKLDAYILEETKPHLIILAAPLETYDADVQTLFGDALIELVQLDCNIAEGQNYHDAVQFLKNRPGLTITDDHYAYRQKERTRMSAIRIGLLFLMAMIGVIAVVNMVNILSTGILNRRGELAAMQCIGMTGGQLGGMTVVECLQYALTAGILSTLLCLGLIWGTEQFIALIQLDDMLEYSLSYAAPLGKVWLAAAAAFLTALLSCFIPLGGMQKKPLVEQIRRVD